MNCPICGKGSEVVDSRLQADNRIRRRRRCLNEHRFTTYETYDRTTIDRIAALLQEAASLAGTL